MSNNPNRRARRNRSRLGWRPSADATQGTGADPVARAAYPSLGRWGKPAAAGALAVALGATSLAPASTADAATPRHPHGVEQFAPGFEALLAAAKQDLPDGEREFDPWDLDLEGDHEWTMRSTEAEVATVSVQVGDETVPIAVVDRLNREIQMTGDGISSLVVEPCAPVPGAPDPLHCVALPTDTGGMPRRRRLQPSRCRRSQRPAYQGLRLSSASRQRVSRSRCPNGASGTARR